MSRINRIILMIFVTIVIFFNASPGVAATFYPDHGDLWYGGCHFVDSHFKWTVPGGWSVSDPGYEHDFAVKPDYYTSCTSWTDLPNGYNDCPTAGWSEPGGFWAFSFGSFHATNIVAGKLYYGSWTFERGGSPTTAFYLSGQENYHQFCWWDSIWCMNGIRSAPLTSGQLIFGVPLYRSW